MRKIEFNNKEFKKLFPSTINSVLAIKYGVKESTIRVWAAKLELKKDLCEWSKSHENYVLKYYGKGKTLEEIIKYTGRTRWGIINKYRELNNLRKRKSSAVEGLYLTSPLEASVTGNEAINAATTPTVSR